MFLALVLAALAATPEELDRLASELAAKTPGDDLMLEISDLVDEAPSDEKPALEVAMRLATLLDRDGEPFTEEERLLFYRPVFTGSAADRERVLAHAREGVLPGGPLLEELHLELSVLEPRERVRRLQAWKARPFDAGTAARVEKAYAVAYELKDQDVPALVVAQKLAVALGNTPPEAMEIDFDSYPAELAAMQPSERAKRIEATLSSVDAETAQRLDAALKVARAIADEELKNSRVEFLFQTALSEDPAIRSRAMQAASKAGKPAPRPTAAAEPEAETPEQAASRERKERFKRLDAYDWGRIRFEINVEVRHDGRVNATIDQETGDVEFSSRFAFAPVKVTTWWYPYIGHQKLKAVEWAERVDPTILPRIERRPVIARRMRASGVAITAAGLLAIPAAAYFIGEEEIELGALSLLGATAGVIVGPVLIGVGHSQRRVERYEAFTFYRNGDKGYRALADEYNENLAEELGLTEEDLALFE